MKYAKTKYRQNKIRSAACNRTNKNVNNEFSLKLFWISPELSERPLSMPVLN